MAAGVVKWFNNTNKYGFIVTDDGREVFVHFSEIQEEGFKTLKKGQRVEFDLEESDKGPKAVKVKKITPSPTAPAPGPRSPFNGNGHKKSKRFFLHGGI